MTTTEERSTNYYNCDRCGVYVPEGEDNSDDETGDFCCLSCYSKIPPPLEGVAKVTDWIYNLPLQTLTDELKDDLVSAVESLGTTAD